MDTPLLQWLLEDWRELGPSLAIVEGFSGVGKSQLGRKLAAAWPSGPHVFVSATGASGGLEDLLFDVAAQFEASGEKAVADAAAGDFRSGLLQLLQHPALVVIDHFEELLEPQTRLPSPSLGDFLREVCHMHAPGRVLLLTNQTPALNDWQQGAATKTLTAPPEPKAVELLTQLLTDRGLDGEVPTQQRADLSPGWDAIRAPSRLSWPVFGRNHSRRYWRPVPKMWT